MIPNINPKQMQAAMKRMGIKQEEIDAIEVIIRTSSKDIVITNPQVSKVEMMGQISYQVAGSESERPFKPVISIEDVKMVSEQANVTEEKARDALEATNGDLAKAILDLKQ